MTPADLFRWLLESTCASSAAIVLVLLLRRPLRAAFGANAAYLLWLLLPLAVLAASLPARVVRVVAPEAVAAVGAGTVVGSAPLAPVAGSAAWLLVAWLAGAIAFALWQVVLQRRFHRSLGIVRDGADGHLRAERSAGLPAVIGLRARIVLPADFEVRYSVGERELILAHERIHIARRDVLGNALLAALRCVYWFNPLAWIAADRFRRDQELACDETVVTRHPHARRVYGEAMVKTQLSAMPAPLACHWFGSHPLKERIAMLKRPVPGTRRVLVGLVVAAAVVSGAAYATWAARPATMVATGNSAAAAASPEATIDLVADSQPMREVAIEAAKLAGIRVLNPQILPEKPVSLQFNRMEIQVVMQMLGDEAGLEAVFEPAGVRFVARPETGGDKAPPQADVAANLLAPPKYPADAAANRITGKVVLIVDVAADGSVTDARVEKSEPAGVFDQVSLDAVKSWKFKPAVENGKPVAGRVRVPVNFAMDRDEGDKAGAPGGNA
ncbi:TonB family protein [Luteimonas sp. 22616]|uniref:TonB family protein n=1 Tax=Luteimonas sp. 22616 TaxID=3453951 RepID=UPI003F826169